jgi:hypothetical protein
MVRVDLGAMAADTVADEGTASSMVGGRDGRRPGLGGDDDVAVDRGAKGSR